MKKIPNQARVMELKKFKYEVLSRQLHFSNNAFYSDGQFMYEAVNPKSMLKKKFMQYTHVVVIPKEETDE